METVNFLASLWGFSMVIIALSLLIQPKKAKDILQMLEKEHVLFLHGVIRIVLGTAMLLNYNIFDNSWKVILTVLGWLLLITGAAFLFSPQKVAYIFSTVRNKDLVSPILLSITLLGCFLVYAGFSL